MSLWGTSDRNAYREMQAALRAGRHEHRNVDVPWMQMKVPDLGVPGIPRNVRAFGPCSNAAVIGNLTGAGGVSQCLLGNLDLAPFTQEAMTTNGLGVDGLITASCIVSMRVASPDDRRQVLIHETMAPCVPNDSIMERDAARAELEALFRNPMSLKVQAWWIQYVAKTQVAEWDTTTGLWAQATTLAEILTHVHAAANQSADAIRERVMYTVALAIISFAMRGDISKNRVAKLQQDLRQSMPFIANLSREDITRTWMNYGHLVDHNSAGAVLAQLMTCLPGGCVRLRVCLAQAAGSGMVSLDVVARALREHPDFPWLCIMRMYPSDWEGVALALRAVANHPHYGYKNKLKVVSSTNYRSVAWVCGKLLIKAGEETLKDYKGFKEDSRRVAVIDEMITAYMAHSTVEVDLKSPYTPEEMGGLEQLIVIAREHGVPR